MKRIGSDNSPGNTARVHPRSLPIHQWPEGDRLAWEDACRPGSRFKPGGSASYLAQVSRDDFANRYGAFLGFLQRSDCLDHRAVTAAQVTPTNVDDYIAELTSRVRSVTVWNCVYKLRRAAELLAPNSDFSWLAEIEKDLALVMEPRSKFDRLVFTQRLVEAGLTLVAEAERYATKTKKLDERRVPEILNRVIGVYLRQSRPALIGSRTPTNSLWISSRTGQQLTQKNLGT
jgi:hypothetical protein